MPDEEGTLEVRCEFCARRPLLARCGRDRRTGEPFIHVKTWKGKRLYTEVVVTSGSAHIRCRECMRWLHLTIRHLSLDVRSERLPESIAV